MQVTRRWWTVVGLGATLAVAAVVLDRPVLLGGAVLLGAWLLALQYRFVGDLRQVDETLTVELDLHPERVATGEPVDVALTAATDSSFAVPVVVEARPPIAASSGLRADRTARLDPGEREATAEFQIDVPVAGAYTFDRPRVHVADAAGLFTETLAVGVTPTVDVEPRAPRNVHVGEAGEEIAVTYGEHETGRLGTGIEPTELREYTTGDSAGRIDWKATARLHKAYVREFEAESDRRTVLLLDHRSSMRAGRPGESKLDYAREVALAHVDSARQLDDPLGCYAVGDEGLTAAYAPAATPDRYEAVRRHLRELSTDEDSDREPAAPAVHRAARSPAAARSAARQLADDDSPFAATLHPYFETADPYVERVAQDPLFAAARTHLARLRGTTWSVILTDDANRAELRETVKIASQGDDHVTVFLAPSVLYEPGGLDDLEAAYERYVAFEEFRHDLALLPRVEAFEVAPGDRLSAVLAAGRRRRNRGEVPS